MREHRDQLEARGATVLVIGFEAARRVHAYCRRLDLGNWTCLVDERLVVYHAYGLGQLPWWRTLNLVSLWGYASFWRQGRRLSRPVRTDVRQAGGDFVIAPDGHLMLVRPGRTPHDRPSVPELLAALPAPSESRQ